eukprot:358726-Chlamydomonas_euryale.AAC.1
MNGRGRIGGRALMRAVAGLVTMHARQKIQGQRCRKRSVQARMHAGKQEKSRRTAQLLSS